MRKISVLPVLLLLVVFGQPQAQAQVLASYGDWVVVRADDDSGDVIAATATDGSGKEALGYRCFAKTQECMHVLMPNSTCEADGDYPMLLNAASGASMVTGKCYKTGKTDQLLLRPFDSIRSPIEKDSGLLGFAIPMQSGAFKAIRFSLKGSKAATAAAEKFVQERARTKPSERTGSTIL